VARPGNSLGDETRSVRSESRDDVDTSVARGVGEHRVGVDFASGFAGMRKCRKAKEIGEKSARCARRIFIGWTDIFPDGSGGWWTRSMHPWWAVSSTWAHGNESKKWVVAVIPLVGQEK